MVHYEEVRLNESLSLEVEKTEFSNELTEILNIFGTII